MKADKIIILVILAFIIALAIFGCEGATAPTSAAEPDAAPLQPSVYYVTTNGTSENFKDYTFLPAVQYLKGSKISVSFDYLTVMNPNGTNHIQFFTTSNLPAIFIVGSLPPSDFQYVHYSKSFIVPETHTLPATLRLTIQGNCILLALKNFKVTKIK
jgi:hypothetical protein